MVAPNAPAAPTKSMGIPATVHEPYGIQTSLYKTVGWMGDCSQCGHGFGLRSFYCLMRSDPSRVEQLGKIYQRQTLITITTTSKMEDDRRFHGGEEWVSRTRRGIVNEIRLIYTTVLAWRCGFTDDTVMIKCLANAQVRILTMLTVRPCPSLVWHYGKQ